MDEIKDMCIGVSGDIEKLRFVYHEKNKDRNSIFHKIGHFSLGARVWDEFDDEIVAMANMGNMTISFHPVDINFSGKLIKEEMLSLKKLIKKLPISYLEEDIGIWRCGDLFLGPHQTNPALNEEGILVTAKNILFAREFFEKEIALENPPVYSELGDINFWDYYVKLCEESKAYFAFDLGHYIGYCRTLESDATVLPDMDNVIWDKIITIHISGMKKWKWRGVSVWLDQHSDPFDEDLISLYKQCKSWCKRLENTLLEQEGANHQVEKLNINSIWEAIYETSPRFASE
ncbi:hypothetical protein CKY10_05895 [Photorhabdus sp. HUG-39]|uniref:DUF692 family protein n=1 Tax=Photorhabdus kayaii TaxID=230088 RepID=A0ABX0B2G2_9GAMM|nr:MULTISPECIES: DUF692 family multinuclear iron-containing protein [Photorhabdus]MCC8372544.1 DUF692 family protein [Photorhabdus bodei]MDB6368191.1 DUF692 family protein [Photorhabdus bodei]NDL11312.1 DUF692 family protein [Photorhabdus kayaii]NDL24944.1 DUF692 family protein [Photorhabdus kayaii]RAX10951.1 hypothetical protein CKY10_05895 [Photorhabdus sp. HUG-39]